MPSSKVIKVNAEERLVAIKLTTLPPGVSPTPKVAPPPPTAAEEATPVEVVAASPATETEEASSPATEA